MSVILLPLLLAQAIAPLVLELPTRGLSTRNFSVEVGNPASVTDVFDLEVVEPDPNGNPSTQPVEAGVVLRTRKIRLGGGATRRIRGSVDTKIRQTPFYVCAVKRPPQVGLGVTTRVCSRIEQRKPSASTSSSPQ